jgi:hypothetical protein
MDDAPFGKSYRQIEAVLQDKSRRMGPMAFSFPVFSFSLK